MGERCALSRRPGPGMVALLCVGRRHQGLLIPRPLWVGVACPSRAPQPRASFLTSPLHPWEQELPGPRPGPPQTVLSGNWGSDPGWVPARGLPSSPLLTGASTSFRQKYGVGVSFEGRQCGPIAGPSSPGPLTPLSVADSALSQPQRWQPLDMDIKSDRKPFLSRGMTGFHGSGRCRNAGCVCLGFVFFFPWKAKQAQGPLHTDTQRQMSAREPGASAQHTVGTRRTWHTVGAQ